jgi:heat shock protein HslJ
MRATTMSADGRQRDQQISCLQLYVDSDILKAGPGSMVNNRGAVLVLLAAAVSTAGPAFALAPAGSDAPPEMSKLQGIELRLVRLRINEKEIALPAGARITLTFRTGGQISGRSAVNGYGGTYRALPDDKVDLTITITGQMAGPKELMDLEKQYFDALPRLKRILVKPDHAILEGDSASMEFTFSSHK